MFYESKQLISIASRSPQNTKDILSMLIYERNKILFLNKDVQREEEEEISEEEEGTFIQDITDEAGRRRGRPKKCQNSRDIKKSTRCRCEICCYNHPTTDCSFFAEMQYLREKHANDRFKRHCSLCGSPSHNLRTCDLRIRAREFYGGIQ